jgi:acetyltransferase-like isoleucine patch superfamily enzyme
MNAFFRDLAFKFLRLFYKQGEIQYSSVKYLFTLWFVQKIIGINRSIPWPVHWTSQVKAWENVEIGDEMPGIGICCYIDGRNGIIIERNVWIAPKVSIISQNHDNLDYTSYVGSKPILIGRDSLLAAGCIILPGVELGPHTIVGAGAIVTKSFPEGNQLIAGNPARVIKKLDAYKEGADYKSQMTKTNSSALKQIP